MTRYTQWLYAAARSSFILALGFIILPVNIFAQEDDDDEKEDIYEISPFVIQEGEESGYIATQTLAGTRLRSSLQDIGASVQVITTEFLDDIAATDSNDLLLFTTSTETAGLGGNFSGGNASVDNRVLTGGALNNPQSTNRIRGLGAPDNTRDFFITDIPFDSYNTGRIEINRGANAILFGLGSPSGVLNAGLNRAVFDEINQVELRIQDGGDDPSYRATLDFNRVLIEDKLAVRVNALSFDRNYSQRPAFQMQNRYYITATYKPFENTVIRTSYENGIIRANQADSVGPLQAIDHYIREVGRYHDLLAADKTFLNDGTEAPTEFPNTNLPLIYDPWRFSMRYEDPGRYTNLNNGNVNAIIDWRRVDQRVDNYDQPFLNQGFGQVLGMIWEGNTAEPSFGMPGVIANGAQWRKDIGNPGFQHKVWYDARRPVADAPPNPRAPRGGRNFRSIANAGGYDYGDFSGVYEGFNDLGLFDFSRYLLGGTAPFQNRDFEAFHASLEQTFFENKMGFELAFTKQKFKRKSFNGFPGSANGIVIDINETLPIGTFDHNNEIGVPIDPIPNPNFGRPFMVANANQGKFSSDRKSLRWTGFWEFNTADLFGEDSIWSTIFGRHVLTGLASRQELDTANISFSQRAVGPREANLNETFSTSPGQRSFRYLTYLGPPVDLKSNPAGITRNMFEINPVENQNVFSDGGAPVRTTYYDIVKQEMVTHDIGRQLSAVNGELNGTVNDSLAVIMQSFLVDENIVGTLGWRQDEVTNNLANTAIFTDTVSADKITELGIVNTSYEDKGIIARNAAGDYLFEDPQITFVKEDIFSWGAVAKLPRNWNPFGWLNSASIFYNQSENFQPAPGRENHLGEQVPSPTGTTQDYGFNFAFLDNKFNLRINRFEAAINNASNNGVNRVYAQSESAAAGGWINNVLVELANADFEELVEDETSPFFGEKLRMEPAELEALLNEFTNWFGFQIDRSTGNVTLDTSNPLHKFWTENSYRAVFNESLGVVDGLDQNLAGQTDTVDQVTEGTEIELVANPMRGLRVLLNVAKVETANSNIAPTMRKWIEEEVGPFYAGTPTNPSKFGRLMRGGPGRRPELKEDRFPGASSNEQWFTREVLRDWNTIKAQEGTFSPEVRKWRANAVVNYDFQEGFLQGFGTGFSMRYQSKVAIGFPIAPNAEGIPTPDIDNPYTGPSEINWGLRFSYRKRIFDNKVNWRVQLNLSNINSNRSELIPVRFTDNGLLAQSRTAAPRGWVLSSRFDW